jgi:tetratricopeptide (TPR) repeat protein
LGYFYLYEGEPNEDSWRYQEGKAISILEKAVSLNPKSHMPYSVLGEAYLIKNENSKAEAVLKNAVNIERTSANLNNLGVALYRQSKFQEAKEHFYTSHLIRKSKYYTFRPYLNYGMALAKLGMRKEAVEVAEYLINNLEKSSFEIDLIDIISIYYEIDDLRKVAELYPKAFEEIAISPEYFEMYIFALKILGCYDIIEKLYIDTIKEKEQLIKDIKEDDEIDEECKKYQVSNILEELFKYRNSYSKVENGEIIKNYYEPFIEKDCYLFGCLRHGNPVYS